MPPTDDCQRPTRAKPAPRQLVTFDWALKRLLRSKANFKVLEGFLSELLCADLHIEEMLESESNKEDERDKYNRVDMLVKDSAGRRIIIELQYTRQDDYLQRMLYGTAKILTQSMGSGDIYGKIARVVSVNIIHFDLGQGKDYIYEGKTEFLGVHRRDRLELSEAQKAAFAAETVGNIFPEYFLLKVNNFNDTAKDGLDQWVYFLKNGKIKPSFHAKGLREAQEALDILNLSETQRLAYERYIEQKRIDMSVAESTVLRAERAEKALEEAKAREEEAKAQAGKALAAKDAAIQAALAALIAAGVPEPQARITLGLPPDN